ncbi:MAG: acyl-CoA thioesterase [Alphaproteobacteria bacterium]
MADWMETFKGAVLTSEYDPSAHMNSQIYVSRFDQATWFLLSSIGVTPAKMRQAKQRVAIVRQGFQYLRELKGGDLVEIKSGFVAVGKKYIRFHHRMLDPLSGDMVASSDCTGVLADLSSGKSVALPAALKKAAEAHLVTFNVAED